MKAAVLLLQLIYFWAGTVTQFPGPALVPSPTGPAASSPPERCLRGEPRVLSQALMPQCHRGFTPTSIPVIPSFLFLRNSLHSSGMAFLQGERKNGCGFCQASPNTNAGAFWGFSLTRGSHLPWEITAPCSRTKSDSNMFLVFQWKNRRLGILQ